MSNMTPYTLADELANGIHDFDADSFKLALYTEEAPFTRAVQVYAPRYETSGTGYIPGGFDITLSVQRPEDQGGASVIANDVVVEDLQATYKWGLVYNTSKNNRVIAILDFTWIVSRGRTVFSFDTAALLQIGG